MYYWRLSGFYFFYFAALGALVPYWGLYLKALGFSAVDIGELVAIIMATKVIAPNVWGWIADHTGRKMTIIRAASLSAAVAFAGVFAGHGYGWMALVMAVFSFFWNAALPQFEATTLNHLGDEARRYSSIRLWGSIGFIVSVTALGMLFQTRGTDNLPTILLLLFVSIWLFSLFVPDSSSVEEPSDQKPLRSVLKRPAVGALFLVCFLMQASHGPYYAFYSLYLTAHGYTETSIGQLWALGVVAEIMVFLAMPRWLPRFSDRRLLLVAALLTAVRWALIGLYVDRAWILMLAQTLHAASFGVYHAVAIHLVHRFFQGRHQGRGQALYSSVSFGAGGAAGSFAAGYLWEGVGAQWMYGMASGTALVATWIVWRHLAGSETSQEVA